jgi:hypothetical protein
MKNEPARNETVRHICFQEVRHRAVAKTHIAKAYRARPHDVDALMATLRRIESAGPLLTGCRDVVIQFGDLDTRAGKRRFGGVAVGGLLAIIRWDSMCFSILALIDVERLARREKRKQCFIVDFEVDIDGTHLPIALFVNDNNHIVCCTMANWSPEEIISLHYDPYCQGQKAATA